MLTAFRLPVELDVGDLASLVDQGISMDAKALHVTVVQGHTNIIHQECELHNKTYASAMI